MKIPTEKELFDCLSLDSKSYLLVDEDTASWGHGVTLTQVFKCLSEGTFWRVSYEVSSDTEYNGLREGGLEIQQVEPYEQTVTMYKKV